MNSAIDAVTLDEAPVSRQNITLRKIASGDDAGVAELIRTVMPEIGAQGPGFAINDAEVDCMFSTYTLPGHRYFVLERMSGGKSKIVGGCGIGPLLGGPEDVCELKKMYFIREIRGFGFGKKLLDEALAAARELGYKRCYIETLKQLHTAVAVYVQAGFKPLPGPMGDTGHFSCNSWFIKQL